MSDEKIGIGIITCDRQDFYKKCLASIPGDKNKILVTINDGSPYADSVYNSDMIQHTSNKGVGVSKNDAMKWLLKEGCEHIFLIEDDIVIKNPTVFEEYIRASKITGLQHLMYGYHGPANKLDGKPAPRVIIDYDSVKIALNPHCVGAFCYYSRRCLEECGLMDEKYFNALEHIDHSLTIAKAGMIPAYWWWPDIANSMNYLDELACSEVSSTIRPRPDWQKNIQNGAIHFREKHGYEFTGVPNRDAVDVFGILKKIKEKYSEKTVAIEKLGE